MRILKPGVLLKKKTSTNRLVFLLRRDRRTNRYDTWFVLFITQKTSRFQTLIILKDEKKSIWKEMIS